jgi:carboxypeptidase Q
MKHTKSILALLLVQIILLPVYSQDKYIKSIIQTGQSDNRTMQHLDVLANRFGGRIIGSDAYENASFWCADQFRKWGMEVQMDEVGSLPVGFNRGPWSGKLLSETEWYFILQHLHIHQVQRECPERSCAD